jgi:phosphorylase kinase alpha/beta subunit
MAKAALEAMDELDLFGSRGGDSSIIHVMPDTIHWCNTILSCMLPRESNSKETDAALLSIISYPAFALNDMDLVNLTRNEILTKLQGRYGCCRFIRDGYKTAKEDPRRLHYEPWELKVFENIECEWPLFWCYLVLDGIFYDNDEQVELIAANLEQVLIKDEESIKLVPELYAVPAYKVDDEYKAPKTQDRVPLGKIPHLWGQSLYIISKLLRDSLIAPGELDPLNKRLVIQPKPDLVVQICVLAEDREVQIKLHCDHNITVPTVEEVSSIAQIYPAKVLSYIYSFLGKNERLGLSGRPVTDVGLLATSKFYTLKGQLLAFTPSFMDHKSFYLATDLDFSLDLFRTYVSFIERNWNNIPGRPTVVFLITKEIYEAHETLNSALISTIKKLHSGYINGARVQLGRLEDFIKTACLTSLTFLGSDENTQQENERKIFEYINSLNASMSKSSDLIEYKASLMSESSNANLLGIHPNASTISLNRFGQGSSSNRTRKLGGIIGIAKRSRSIHYTECPRMFFHLLRLLLL